MSTNNSNIISPLTKPTADSTSLECFAHGYRMSEMKNGITPLPPFLPGTTQYRWWMEGWDTYVLNKKKERSTGDD